MPERWKHLTQMAFALEENHSVQGTLLIIDSALEAFPSTIDPIEDFEGYAVRRFLLALRLAVGKPEPKD